MIERSIQTPFGSAREEVGQCPHEDAGRRAGSEDPVAQAQEILAESDERTADRDAAPTSVVEHRRSEDTVDPT
jgi:hypothetical protein